MSADNGKSSRNGSGLDDLADAGRSVWLAGLGALAELERGSREAFDRMVERGRKVERQQLRAIDHAVAAAAEGAEKLGEKVRHGVQDGVEDVLHSVNLPSRDDLKVLASYLDRLAERIDALGGGR